MVLICHFLAFACFERLLMKLSISLIAPAASFVTAQSFGGFVTVWMRFVKAGPIVVCGHSGTRAVSAYNEE